MAEGARRHGRGHDTRGFLAHSSVHQGQPGQGIQLQGYILAGDAHGLREGRKDGKAVRKNGRPEEKVWVPRGTPRRNGKEQLESRLEHVAATAGEGL
eukprot:15230157-Heterocapsa_arctica.AAC.1